MCLMNTNIFYNRALASNQGTFSCHKKGLLQKPFRKICANIALFFELRAIIQHFLSIFSKKLSFALSQVTPTNEEIGIWMTF